MTEQMIQMGTEMAEAVSDVVWPLGNRQAGTSVVKQVRAQVGDARVGFAWDLLFHGDRMWDLIQAELTRRWPDITFVGPDEFGNFHDKTIDDVSNATLTERMRAHEISAAIIGVGA
jgi:hypothetical protein